MRYFLLLILFPIIANASILGPDSITPTLVASGFHGNVGASIQSNEVPGSSQKETDASTLLNWNYPSFKMTITGSYKWTNVNSQVYTDHSYKARSGMMVTDNTGLETDVANTGSIKNNQYAMGIYHYVPINKDSKFILGIGLYSQTSNYWHSYVAIRSKIGDSYLLGMVTYEPEINISMNYTSEQYLGIEYPISSVLSLSIVYDRTSNTFNNLNSKIIYRF